VTRAPASLPSGAGASEPAALRKVSRRTRRVDPVIVPPTVTVVVFSDGGVGQVGVAPRTVRGGRRFVTCQLRLLIRAGLAPGTCDTRPASVKRRREGPGCRPACKKGGGPGDCGDAPGALGTARPGGCGEATTFTTVVGSNLCSPGGRVGVWSFNRPWRGNAAVAGWGSLGPVGWHAQNSRAGGDGLRLCPFLRSVLGVVEPLAGLHRPIGVSIRLSGAVQQNWAITLPVPAWPTAGA
jgi:hypothetical protein